MLRPGRASAYNAARSGLQAEQSRRRPAAEGAPALQAGAARAALPAPTLVDQRRHCGLVSGLERPLHHLAQAVVPRLKGVWADADPAGRQGQRADVGCCSDVMWEGARSRWRGANAGLRMAWQVCKRHTHPVRSTSQQAPCSAGGTHGGSPVHRRQLLGGEAAHAHAHRLRGQRNEVGEAAIAVARAAELCLGGSRGGEARGGRSAV